MTSIIVEVGKANRYSEGTRVNSTAIAPSTGRGDDIWVAVPNTGGAHQPASEVVRFASLTDCGAEPTGIYFDLSGTTLFVHAQHRGGDGLDKSLAITKNRP